MLQRHESRVAEGAFRALWLGAVGLPAEPAQNSTIRDSILSLITVAHQNRDMRLFEMARGVPGLIWVLLLFFVAVLVGFLLLFGVQYVASRSSWSSSTCSIFRSKGRSACSRRGFRRRLPGSRNERETGHDGAA